MPLYTPSELSKLLGVQPQTLRLWETNGSLQAIKTESGHRRYLYTQTKKRIIDKPECTNIIYARVSSYKQSKDLQRQIEFLQSKYPTYTVIKDIGGGVNFQRKGLQTLLERAMSGTIKRIVVAHRDRLCRFGFEFLEWIFFKHGVLLEVVAHDEEDNYGDITDDVLAVITHFTAKLYGSRKYKLSKGGSTCQKNSNLSIHKNEEVVLSMLRGLQIFLQPNKCFLEETKRKNKIFETHGDEKTNLEK